MLLSALKCHNMALAVSAPFAFGKYIGRQASSFCQAWEGSMVSVDARFDNFLAVACCQSMEAIHLLTQPPLPPPKASAWTPTPSRWDVSPQRPIFQILPSLHRVLMAQFLNLPAYSLPLACLSEVERGSSHAGTRLVLTNKHFHRR